MSRGAGDAPKNMHIFHPIGKGVVHLGFVLAAQDLLDVLPE